MKTAVVIILKYIAFPFNEISEDFIKNYIRYLQRKNGVSSHRGAVLSKSPHRAKLYLGKRSSSSPAITRTIHNLQLNRIPGIRILSLSRKCTRLSNFDATFIHSKRVTYVSARLEQFSDLVNRPFPGTDYDEFSRRRVHIYSGQVSRLTILLIKAFNLFCKPRSARLRLRIF